MTKVLKSVFSSFVINLKLKKMKKVLLALAIIGLIGFASCRKTRTCECTYLGVSMGTYTIVEDCSALESVYGYNCVEK